MIVGDCRHCSAYREKRYSIRRKPNNYHTIGQTYRYGWCTYYNARCLSIKRCEQYFKERRGGLIDEY